MGDVDMNVTVGKAKVMSNKFGKTIRKWWKLSLTFSLKVFGFCHILAFSTSSEILNFVVLTTAGTSLLHFHVRL